MKNKQNIYKTLNTMTVIWTLLLSIIIPTQAKPIAANSVFNQDTIEQYATPQMDKSIVNNSVYFEQNNGQFNEKVKYFARGANGYSLFLTATEAVYLVREKSDSNTLRKSSKNFESKHINTRFSPVFMKLIGANESTESIGLEELEHKNNYFKGKRSNWKKDIPNFKQVQIKNVYEGIDTVWKGNENDSIQYDFVIKPNANPNQIEWEIEGAESIEIDEKGNLVIENEFGTIIQEKPVTFQETDNLTQEIESSFELKANNQIGFNIGEYDSSGTLSIVTNKTSEKKPTDTNNIGQAPLQHSTLWGGSMSDGLVAIEVGNDRRIYVAGTTASANLPTTTGVLFGDRDGIIAVFNEAGTGLLYSSIFGSAGSEIATDMKLNKTTKRVYISGVTENIENGVPFPTTSGTYDNTENGGTDAFLYVLVPDQNFLRYSTLLGGEHHDEAIALEIDDNENVYIGGITQTSAIFVNPFPTTAGAYNTTHNGMTDIFVAKIDTAINNNPDLLYSTLIGGAVFDKVQDIALDSSGNVYIVGLTKNSGLFGNYPTTPGSYDRGYNGGDYDAIVTKLNSTGSSLIYSTFLGGDQQDIANALTIDSSGNAYVVGQTSSFNVPFPTTSGAFDETTSGSGDAFLTKVNSTGSQILFSTFLGGSQQDIAEVVTLDGVGNILVGGNASSQNFPITPNSYDASITGFNEAFLTRFNSSGSEVTYSTFIGGGSVDNIYGIYAKDPTTIYFVGETNLDPSNGIEYPTTNGAYDRTHNGDYDAFITEFYIPQPISSSAAPYDFDGDSKTDISIFRPNVGEWWYLRSFDGGNSAFQFGSSTDVIVPGDYTGDGKTDLAVWRPSNGFWFVIRSEDNTFFGFPFGASGDIPAPGDFDGDGKTDAAIYRPSNGTWYINQSSGGTRIESFGISEDKPVVADYDGDGKDDISIYRPSNSQWWINRSSDGVIVYQFGQAGDKTVQGDYTGDGKADVAFWRPSNGFWFVLRSEDSSFFGFPFGASSDTPAPGDYDGDGRYDAAVFRPNSSTWFINGSTSGTQITTFGTNGDKPVPNAYVYQ